MMIIAFFGARFTSCNHETILHRRLFFIRHRRGVDVGGCWCYCRHFGMGDVIIFCSLIVMVLGCCIDIGRHGSSGNERCGGRNVGKGGRGCIVTHFTAPKRLATSLLLFVAKKPSVCGIHVTFAMSKGDFNHWTWQTPVLGGGLRESIFRTFRETIDISQSSCGVL